MDTPLTHDLSPMSIFATCQIGLKADEIAKDGTRPLPDYRVETLWRAFVVNGSINWFVRPSCRSEASKLRANCAGASNAIVANFLRRVRRLP